MANGTAALFVFEPTSESYGAPAEATADKPDLGVAVADAVIVLYQAIIDQQQSGAITSATKDAGGSRIATIALLQLDHELGDDDFVALAHHAGKRELHRHLGADLFRQHGPAEIDKVFDASISDVLGIVTRVVKDERIFRAAWAN